MWLCVLTLPLQPSACLSTLQWAAFLFKRWWVLLLLRLGGVRVECLWTQAAYVQQLRAAGFTGIHVSFAPNQRASPLNNPNPVPLPYLSPLPLGYQLACIEQHTWCGFARHVDALLAPQGLCSSRSSSSSRAPRKQLRAIRCGAPRSPIAPPPLNHPPHPRLVSSLLRAACGPGGGGVVLRYALVRCVKGGEGGAEAAVM